MRQINLDDIPILDWKPFRYRVRYQRETRRPFLKGDKADRDIRSACAGIEAVVHEAPSGLLTIVRGRQLAQKIR